MARFTSQSALSYDERIGKLVPGYELLQALLPSVMSSLLTEEASVLIAGAGTGMELGRLAQRQAGWRFAAVDPSAGMLEVARARLHGTSAGRRVIYFETALAGYRPAEPHDAAVSLLVAHFLPDDGAREDYFRKLGQCLVPGAPLVFADLTLWDTEGQRTAYRDWAVAAGQSPDEAEAMLARIAENFHPLGEVRQREILEATGFAPPVAFFQALGYRGYVTRRR